MALMALKASVARKRAVVRCRDWCAEI